MTEKIQSWGNSQGIRIPKSVLEALHWKNNENVSLTTLNDSLIIKKSNPRKSIKELFENYHEEYTPSEFDWGEPVGKEAW